MEIEIFAWLDTEPDPKEIAKNNDGYEHIPIPIIESLLDQFTRKDWSTRNFGFTIQPYATTLLISASVELEVNYRICEDGIWSSMTRTLTGAVTFTDADYGSNLDFAAIALSECIKNAAKKLGPRFGKNLNGRGEMKKPVERPKPKMDRIIEKKYRNAVEACDIQTITEIEQNYDTEK